jgi:maltose alpha-D-glucosyltransferase/alpha-amylase
MTEHADEPGWAEDPLWYKDAVIYQLHVKAFHDANGDGIGDFAGLREKLDYLQELGVNALWLLPFYPSPQRDDGYDIADYRGINPAYGTMGDFRAFVREAHRRGLKLITELIVNHTSDQHPWFQKARRAPRGSAARDYYVWSDDDRKYAGTRIIFTDTETSNWTWDPVAKQYYWHRFFSHQPDLNFANPAVEREVSRVMRYWLDMGVDGLRLDAIPYLCERDGTNNENLPETHEVLKRLRAVVDRHYDARMLLAEANQWPEDVREYFGQGDECHMAYHFPLMPRIYMALALEDRYPVTEILGQTPDIPENCQWAIFLRNHDELTLEMVTDRERDYMYSMYAKDARMRVNVGIRRRLAPLLDNDLDRMRLMNSLLLSMPGSPIMYYGDEIGMGDNIYLGDRNSVRTPMQWSPDRNGGFSRADPQRLYLPAIMDPVYGYQAVNVEAQLRDPSSLLNWTRRMLAIRRQFQAFGRGALELVKPGNRKVLAYVRSHGNDVVLCVANLARTAQAVELDLSRYRGRVPIELMGRAAFPPIGELPYLMTLPGHGFFWLRLAESGEVPAWHVERLEASELSFIVLAGQLGTFVGGQTSATDKGTALRALHQLESRVLPDFLRARRWYSRDATDSANVSLGPRGLWQTGRGSWLLTLPEARFEDGAVRRYFMPLAISREGHEDRQLRTVEWALAKVRERAEVGVLVDAFGDKDFCIAVAEGISAGLSLPMGDGTLVFAPGSHRFELEDGALEPVENLPGEHSSAAVVLDERLFLKGYRRIRGGVSPDVEMSRHLSEVLHFPHVAPLAGHLEYRSADGGRVTLAALFGYVHNQGDAWSYTLNHLERHCAVLLHDAAPEEGASHALYLQQLRVMGQRVGELHAVLSQPSDDAAFRPQPLRRADLERTRRRLLKLADDCFASLGQSLDRLPEASRGGAQSLMAAGTRLRKMIREASRAPGNQLVIRTHGDLQLGKLLVARDDFVIIDFEGERSWTYEERRSRQPVQRDIAGMLASLDQARRVALRRGCEGRPDRAALLARDLGRWHRAAQRAFLAGYREGYGASLRGLPDPLAARPLIQLFQVEAELLQLQHELLNRPERATVPLTGLIELLQRPSDAGD